MERRRMRGKPGFTKRMVVSILSLAMLLSMFSPGLIAGAEETSGTSLLEQIQKANDAQTLSGGGELSSLALTYIARLGLLEEKAAALDPASETYAADRQALMDEAAGIKSAASAAYQNGELTEADWNQVTQTYQGVTGAGQTGTAAAPGASDASLTNKTVTAYVDGKTFAVTGSLPAGVTLSVEHLDDTLAAYIRSDVLGLGALPAGYVSGAYDIKLLVDGTPIQPAEAVTLGVTADGITTKADVAVYHLPNSSAEAVSTDSEAEAENSAFTGEKVENVNVNDGYFAFYTSSFSVYYMSAGNLYAEVEEETEVALNDVAAGYVAQYAVLRAKALALDPQAESYDTDWENLAYEAEQIDNAASASYEAGEFDEAQWNVVSQASADFYAALFGEESVEMEDASTLVDFIVTFRTDGVVAPDPVTVTDGQTISELPMLSWIGEDGQPVKVFAGWYLDEALTQEFTTATVVNSNITLYAKWVEPDAEGVYYVNFYSQDGQTVHLTISAVEGKTVAPAQGPTLVEKIFVGWSTTMQGDSPAAELVAFDFSTPVSKVATNGTLNLYAWYADSVTVNFIANGGTAVPSQIIAEGDTATSVQTTRTGYTFRGWSTDKDTYTAFDFTTPVNEDLTLYAFWNANLVPVTIVYMYENPNDAEYSPAGKSAKVYAPAGSYVSIEKSSITNMSGSHYVRYAETMDGALSGYAKQSANANSGNATIPDIQDTYFQYENASNKRWVNPDGSTTILVYYNRARVTLTFAYDQSNTTASIDYTNLITEANRTKYAVSYTQDSNSEFTYSFNAKYGEDITAVWPQVGWVKDSSGNTPSYTSGGYFDKTTYTFYAWQCPDEHHQSSNMYTLESSLFINKNGGGLSIDDGELIGTGRLSDAFRKVYKDWLIYARTTLPGESVDFIYGGKNYTIYKEACQLGYTNTGTFGYKALNGCTPATDRTLYTDYANNMDINYLSVNTGSSLKAKFDETFPNQISSGDNCQVLLYDRSNLTLSVWTYDDTNGTTPQTRNYLYGDKIYNEDTDLLKSLENSMKKEGHVFAGWYTTSEFTPGTEYNPDENSTITDNMNLYAKWEPNQFRAEYYLYVDDADPYAWQGFAEGGKIDDKLVPSAVQDSFLGWYWYQNGQLVPFDFTSAVGANHVDENDVLKLYAKWSGTNGKVSYLPGIGGDNATQEVVDKLDYAINEAAVQLPQYTTVWTDGSVPNDQNLTFVGWKAPNGAIYQPGRYVLVTRNLMQFEAQWSADAVKLIYNANGGVGDDVTETWARGSAASIWDNMNGTAPHFTRENYTLLGWDENPDATTPTYQLGQGSITLSKDVTTLYAIWKLNTVELTIQKTVSGNMYNPNEEFSFTLSYDGKSETFTLKGGESETFQVPVGAEVTVTEVLTESNGYTPNIGTGTTVTLTTALEKDGIFKFTMPGENGKLVINNDKTVTIDTGIELNSFPFIMMLSSVIVMAVFFLIGKKRMMF